MNSSKYMSTGLDRTKKLRFIVFLFFTIAERNSFTGHSLNFFITHYTLNDKIDYPFAIIDLCEFCGLSIIAVTFLKCARYINN